MLYYPDVPEAVAWLTTALSFTERLRNSQDRRQLLQGNGAIIVAKPGAHSDVASSTLQGPGAHSITLRVTAIDELFGRAKAAGARFLAEPADHMYGERQCSFLDPWGHPWTLSETTGRLTRRCSQRLHRAMYFMSIFASVPKSVATCACGSRG